MNIARVESFSVLNAEDKAYWQGYKDGISRANNRYAQFIGTEAFAAIRRAAAVARRAERDAAVLRLQGSHDTAGYAESEALGIRRAIRAAIGSEKAA